MKRMDDVIRAVTYRFGPDAELQAEIARELLAHLEDSFEAARAGGMDDAHAEEAAVRAFGEPEEVGEKLWQANRRRMRFRAVAKWTGRLALMPAGILLAVWLSGATLEVLAGMQLLNNLSGNRMSSWLREPGWLLENLYCRLPPRENLNDEQRLALEANAAQQTSDRTIMGAWDRLILRYPDNPMYRARHYAIFLARALREKAPLLPSHPQLFDRAATLLDAGEKADPGNAFWNYMKADLLMYASGAATLKENPAYALISNKPTAAQGKGLVFTDRPMFERGLEEYRKGLAKPFCRSYATEFGEEVLALRKPPETLLNEGWMITEWGDILLPDIVRMVNMTRGAMDYAALQIDEGHPQEAEALIRTAPVAGAQVGAESRMSVYLKVANSLRQTALREGAALYERLGKRDLATEALALARKESQQEGIFLQTMSSEGEERKFIIERAGLLGGELFTLAPLADRSIPSNLARAERLLAERAALAVLALLYLIAVGGLGISTVWHLWRHRKDTRGPKLYFVGWRRLAWIVAVAVALPLAAYVIFTRAFDFGSAHYGINYQPGRVALEMGGAVVLIFGLSLFLGWRAARLSCRKAAITDRVQLRISVRRSLLPILVVCLLLVGIVSQAYLRYGESSAVKALSQPGRRPFLDEMDYLVWKDYKDYLRALPDHGALPADSVRR